MIHYIVEYTFYTKHCIIREWYTYLAKPSPSTHYSILDYIILYFIHYIILQYTLHHYIHSHRATPSSSTIIPRALLPAPRMAAAMPQNALRRVVLYYIRHQQYVLCYTIVYSLYYALYYTISYVILHTIPHTILYYATRRLARIVRVQPMLK